MKICCIETQRLPGVWTGGPMALPVDFFSYIYDADMRWVERSEAETNRAYKQIIPYVVMRRGSGEVLCYPRHGTESRLHGLYSCGIGGHIDIQDQRETFAATVSAGLRRELSEELGDYKEAEVRLMYRGIIHETETAVGQVHLGIVYVAHCLEGYTPRPGEELAGMEWKTLEELGLIPKERWSDLALQLVEGAGRGGSPPA